ncbi:MAG: recombination mediator RecR [Flavobacteriales bacterium]
MDLPSKLLERTVEYFESLPGVGRRTALRYALHVLKMPPKDGRAFGESITRMVNELGFCQRCHNIADHDLCQICAHPKRDHGTICVVEDLRDLLALEGTGQYFGVYHVLGGIISPMDGVGPSDLHIESLALRCDSDEIKEVIFALPATMEGDTTCFYLFKKLGGKDISITSLARGVAVGNELQYTDEVTLGRSILGRLPYETSLKAN